MEKNLLRKTLANSINWFQSSSVMTPADGSWGVGERIYVCADRELREKVFSSFNSWTDYGRWSVIESRRPDCNFETALLFLLAERIFGLETYGKIACNILDFMYFRSGLLNRGVAGHTPLGVWNWSHTRWDVRLWFDDHAWTLAIPLAMAKMRPDLDEKYELTHWASKLAPVLADAFRRTLRNSIGKPLDDMSDPENLWFGRVALPHWGSLVCFALSAAIRARLDRDGEYAALVREYHEFLMTDEADARLNASELAYAVTGAAAASASCPDPEFYLKTACAYADRLLAKSDPETGNIPAEHYEAPQGAHLVDTIYTANWALLGFQNLLHVLPNDPQYRGAFERLLRLFAKIQDITPERPFRGCWRGMYDCHAQAWGGGESYEGGAGSIYSGWTNAPVAVVFANELLGSSLLD